MADENVEAEVVAWLRLRGHDVAYAAESLVSNDDCLLLNLATREQRVVLTYDADFGGLVFREEQPAAGVILLRFRGKTKAERLSRFMSVWPEIAEEALGFFIVVANTRVRVRRLPGKK